MVPLVTALHPWLASLGGRGGPDPEWRAAHDGAAPTSHPRLASHCRFHPYCTPQLHTCEAEEREAEREMSVPCARAGGRARKVGRTCACVRTRRPRSGATAAYRSSGRCPRDPPRSSFVRGAGAVIVRCRSTSGGSACRGPDLGGSSVVPPFVAHALRRPDWDGRPSRSGVVTPGRSWGRCPPPPYLLALAGGGACVLPLHGACSVPRRPLGYVRGSSRSSGSRVSSYRRPSGVRA